MAGFKNYLLNDAALIKSPFYIKYGIPILLAVVITIIKIEFNNYIGYKTPFLLYFGLVIITSRYFGKKPAILVTIVSAVLVNLLFIFLGNTIILSKEIIVQFIVFILECALIISLSSALSKAVKRINESDIRFRILVEKSSEGIITINANGQIIYCSPSVQNIIGYTDDEFLKLPAWQLLHQDEALEVKERFFRFASRPGEHLTLIHQMKHKNGQWIWIESKMTNLLGEAPINAVIANFTDITARVLDNKLREDFISIASHELKSPLTSLKAYTQVLQSRFKNSTDETTYNIINKIELQVSKVIQMVTSLMDVTSLQQKKLSLNIHSFDFNTLVTEIVDALQQTTKTHHISTALVQTPRLSADRERIAQVITNLVSNAIKYSPNATEVLINTKIECSELILSVHDKGIGIPKKDIDKVFAQFYRVDDSRKNFQGLGLGLFICSQIIEHHGGKIGVESELNQGSNFWFSLPINA